jgi:hypothetical protein
MPTILLSAPYMIPFVDRFRPVFDHFGLDLLRSPSTKSATRVFSSLARFTRTARTPTRVAHDQARSSKLCVASALQGVY